MMTPRSLTTLLLALVLTALPGCKSVRRFAPLSPPIVTLELENLTKQERRVLVHFMEMSAARRWRVENMSNPGNDVTETLAYRVHLHRWSDQAELHTQLVNLRAMPDNHLILQNHSASAALSYTSSQARSESLALVTISVVPAEAELHFDTRVPRALAMPASTTRDGRYQLRLPFAFIKANDHIYFHSIFKGQYRYYRYLLRSERQEILPGVDSPAAMARYLSGR